MKGARKVLVVNYPYKVVIDAECDHDDILQNLAFFNEVYESAGGLVLIYGTKKSALLDTEYLCKKMKNVKPENIEITKSNYNDLFGSYDI